MSRYQREKSIWMWRDFCRRTRTEKIKVPEDRGAGKIGG